MSDYSISCWMDLWLTNFCDSNHDFPVFILIQFWSPSMCQSKTHSCGRFWYLSFRPLPLLLLLTFLSFLFLFVVLFTDIWVCLRHDSQYEVSKLLENRYLIWFSQEIPGHFICGSPLHCHISFVNPISYEKFWCLLFWCISWLMTYHYFS